MKLMKKVASVALATAMTVACVGATTVSADSLKNYGADYLESVKEKGELVLDVIPLLKVFVIWILFPATLPALSRK